MKAFISAAGALAALVGLMPIFCSGSEGGPTTCQNLVFIDLPWAGDSDERSILLAFTVAIGVFLLLWLLTNLVDRKRQ